MGHYDDAREAYEEKINKDYLYRCGVSYDEYLEMSSLQKEVNNYVSIEEKRSRLQELKSRLKKVE